MYAIRSYYDVPLDAIFGNDLGEVAQKVFEKIDIHKSNASNDRKNMQNNSTIISHIVDQVDRLTQFLKINELIKYAKGEEEKFKSDINTLMKNLFSVTLDEMLSGSFPKYLEA